MLFAAPAGELTCCYWPFLWQRFVPYGNGDFLNKIYFPVRRPAVHLYQCASRAAIKSLFIINGISTKVAKKNQKFTSLKNGAELDDSACMITKVFSAKNYYAHIYFHFGGCCYEIGDSFLFCDATQRTAHHSSTI
jgi:hypothetical protein